MPRAQRIRVHHFGGPEVLEWEEFEVPTPGAGEVLLRHTAIGLNFIDIYHRSGLYPMALPMTPGMEGAGVIEVVGPGCSRFQPGDRVAYASGGGAGYSELRTISEDKIVALPEAIDDLTAASVMLKGCTAEYLIRRTYPVTAGDGVLWHAAAGGVGQIAVQWLKHLGARVIGTAGGPEKCEIARKLGCDHVIDYRTEDFAARVAEITGGRGVDVVFDGVGKDTFEGSLQSLKTRGMMVSFGNASGPVPPISPLELTAAGALYLTRPSLAHYYRTREELEEGTAALFDVMTSGAVTIPPPTIYPLKDAAAAHTALAARKTTGSVVLLP